MRQHLGCLVGARGGLPHPANGTFGPQVCPQRLPGGFAARLTLKYSAVGCNRRKPYCTECMAYHTAQYAALLRPTRAVLDSPLGRGLSEGDRYLMKWHAVNTGLQRAGLVEYAAILSAPTRYLMQRHAQLFEAAVAAAAKVKP